MSHATVVTKRRTDVIPATHVITEPEASKFLWMDSGSTNTVEAL